MILIKNLFLPLSGWPISIDDLKVYYRQAAEMLGISYEKFYNKSFFRDTINGISFNQFDRKILFLLENVYQVSNSKNRDFGVKYKKEFETSQNIDVLFHSTVTQLNLNIEGREVESVSISNLIGNKATLKANQFVLACGALENPRILLASNRYYKEGIGNSSGFVGTCFMSHPAVQNVAEVYRTSDEQCIDEDKYSADYFIAFEMSSKQRLTHETLRHSLSIYQFNGLESPSTYISGRIFTQFNKLLDKFDFLSSLSRLFVN